MKRVAILLLLCAVWAVDLMAQEIVTGTVVDGKNEPVPGVRVEIDGRSEYAMTDIDGTFRIELPVTAKKVRVTYPGFKPIVRNIKPDMVIKLGNGWAGKSSGYRGFFDFLMGVGFGGDVNVQAGILSLEDIHPGIAFGFTTTHGYQVNSNLYVGLGFGVMANSIYGKEVYPDYIDNIHDVDVVGFPLFLDLRWDFGLAKKTAPYIGLKAGYKYNVAVDDEYGFLSSYYYGNGASSELELFSKSFGQFFLQPSIGLRTRIGNKAGMNLGLSYNIMETRDFRAVYSFDLYGQYNQIHQHAQLNLGKHTGGVLMFNVGFDF